MRRHYQSRLGGLHNFLQGLPLMRRRYHAELFFNQSIGKAEPSCFFSARDYKDGILSDVENFGILSCGKERQLNFPSRALSEKYDAEHDVFFICKFFETIAANNSSKVLEIPYDHCHVIT